MSAPVLPVDLLGRVWCGHVLDFLPLLPEASVNCVVTSPPYLGLRDYEIEPVIWGGDPACECGAGWRPGIALDPFAGTATAGVTAYRLGREFLGCDVSERYAQIANERLAREILTARLPV